MHEYMVQCTIKQAVLEKDLSSIFGQVQVYCKLRFRTRHLRIKDQDDAELRTVTQLAQASWDKLKFENLSEAGGAPAAE